MTLPLARCRVTAPAGPVLPHPAPGRLVARGVGPPRPFTHSLQAVRRVCRAGSGPLDISEPFHAIQTTESVATNPVDYDAEAPSPRLLGFTFQDVYYYLNIAYWSLLLLSVLTGNDFLSRIAQFETYTTAMFVASTAFSTFFGLKWWHDARRELRREQTSDWRALLRYSWNALFWLGFVLWYSVPPLTVVTDYAGTAGSIACVYGVVLTLSSALMVGVYSFLGEPQLPRKLVMIGPYSVVRHPQILGNFLFIMGFSLAGGAVAATAAFLLSFALYRVTVVPREEQLMESKYGQVYRKYMERVPAFRWGWVILGVIEAVLLWRFSPWSITPASAYY
ncbi:hypothetical protein ACKKBG_A16155 [Auxenochlorella protothecoides x Auxenochlorella symbiontica]